MDSAWNNSGPFPKADEFYVEQNKRLILLSPPNALGLLSPT